MSTKKQFLFLDVDVGEAGELSAKLQAALQARGAEVVRLPLADHYDEVLDRLEDGAVPVVLKL